MRHIVSSTIEDIEGVLDELGLPGKVTGMALLYKKILTLSRTLISHRSRTLKTLL